MCQGGESTDHNDILYCDGCDAGYHQKCHDPEVAALPDESEPWFCAMKVRGPCSEVLSGTEEEEMKDDK